jgi:hypothetical protein
VLRLPHSSRRCVRIDCRASSLHAGPIGGEISVRPDRTRLGRGTTFPRRRGNRFQATTGLLSHPSATAAACRAFSHRLGRRRSARLRVPLSSTCAFQAAPKLARQHARPPCSLTAPRSCDHALLKLPADHAPSASTDPTPDSCHRNSPRRRAAAIAWSRQCCLGLDAASWRCALRLPGPPFATTCRFDRGDVDGVRDGWESPDR